MKKILSALMLIVIVGQLTSITAHATTEEEWLANIQAEQEARMNRLEKEGNLSQDTINSITKGNSTRKSTKKSSKNSTSSNNSSTSSSNGTNKGWVYSTDELHIIGLPEDSETGYTKAGDYGVID